MAQVEAAGGMYAAVEHGLVQKMIGASARGFQEKIESGEQTLVGVNAYQVEEGRGERQALPTPDPAKMRSHIAAFKAYKDARSQAAVQTAQDRLASAAGDPKQNIFARVVDAAEAGCTHGEICATLRREFGFGQPLVVV
jgi:methylmalonyl-CoA mutase N-terminal domain/subunit